MVYEFGMFSQSCRLNFMQYVNKYKLDLSSHYFVVLMNQLEDQNPFVYQETEH
jgi:hypothetical protein